MKKNKSYYKPDKIIFSYGDETVSTTSLLSAPLKWAHEFTKTKNSKKNQNNPEIEPKPIKIIDVCSIYNNKKNIYDNYNKNSSYKILKNEFIGINCEDIDKAIPSSGSHANMIHDKFFMEFFRNILVGNDISYNKEYEDIINLIEDDVLRDMGRSDCSQIFYKD